MTETDEPIMRGMEHDVEWMIQTSPIALSWNGYVRLPARHPWRLLEDWRIPVHVHGGITYGPDEDGWIGFDMVHASDSVLLLDGTSLDESLLEFCRLTGLPEPELHIRSLHECVEETLHLARQAAAAGRDA